MDTLPDRSVTHVGKLYCHLCRRVQQLDCIYIPATAGPTEAPMILIRLLIPSETPLDCLGVESIITFIAPTLVNDNPADRIARFTDTPISV